MLEVLDKRDEAAFSLRDIELASVFARQAAIAISATRIERDATALIASVFSRLMGSPEAAEGAASADIAEIVAAATADPDAMTTHLWALVEQVAQVRAAAPEQLRLVADLIAVLASHAERDRAVRSSRSRRTR